MTDVKLLEVATDIPVNRPQQPVGQSAHHRPKIAPLNWRRLAGPGALVAVIILVVGEVAHAIATMVMGWLANSPTPWHLEQLGLSLAVSVAMYVIGNVIWTRIVCRAEGQLRADLLAAALAQPVAVIGAQPSGELLDRIDDDAAALGRLLREAVWGLFRIIASTIPLWVVSGLSWWPMWILFPISVAVVYLLNRKKLPLIKEQKVIEEAAWSAHAAAFEEAVSARDDLRTNHGQAFATRRLAELSANIHRQVGILSKLSAQVFATAGFTLYGFLGVIAIAGVIATVRGLIDVGQLVTLFIAATMLTGLTEQLIENLPQIQEGLGALTRIKQLLDAESEPVGGVALPPVLDLEFRHVNFRYPSEEILRFAANALPQNDDEAHGLDTSLTRHSTDGALQNDGGPDGDLPQNDDEARGLDTPLTRHSTDGGFGLRDVCLTVPAGQTLALVGRTGSGKSTLASLISRAVNPEPGTVLLGGQDVLSLDLESLRRSIGVVTQRTEILAGTLRENIMLFAPEGSGDETARGLDTLIRSYSTDGCGVVERAIETLGLTDWVAGLPQGLDTLLGAGGTKLSAGEEQLVSFARLLVRDVHLVILDEATARMDPVTERRVIRASNNLLAGRTGVIIAHRLSTIERADLVAVLDRGAVVEFGPTAELAAGNSHYRALLDAAATAEQGSALDDDVTVDEPMQIGTARSARGGIGQTEPTNATTHEAAETADDEPQMNDGLVVTTANGLVVSTDARNSSLLNRPDQPEMPHPLDPPVGMGLMRAVWHMIKTNPQWGAIGAFCFTFGSFLSTGGAITSYLWGNVVESTEAAQVNVPLLVAMILLLLTSRLSVAWAIRVYGWWWTGLLMRVRMAVMRGQTAQRRLPPTPPGEVTSRAMDADRFVYYADLWFDLISGFATVALVLVISRSWLAAGVMLGVMVASAIAAIAGRSIAGRTAAEASATRAQFGRVLVSALDASRTIKLAGRTAEVREHLEKVDATRVRALIRERTVRAVVDGIPVILCQSAVFFAWAMRLTGYFSLPVTLMISSTAFGFIYLAMVAGRVVNEAPGTRSWQVATQKFAGGADLTALPTGVSLISGAAPKPAADAAVPFESLELHDVAVQFDDDGSIGVSDVDLTVHRGEVVLLLGQIGSGKSALLAALAGLRTFTGFVFWNGELVAQPEEFFRPRRIAYVSQVPRVMSGTLLENIQLDHAGRSVAEPVRIARMDVDVAEAGGLGALVGHKGVTLSGGQAQRLALARALATDSDILVADDISSALDANTELELWAALRDAGQTVIGSTSKAAALALADTVVVMVNGQIQATGPWEDLAENYGNLAS